MAQDNVVFETLDDVCQHRDELIRYLNEQDPSRGVVVSHQYFAHPRFDTHGEEVELLITFRPPRDEDPPDEVLDDKPPNHKAS